MTHHAPHRALLPDEAEERPCLGNCEVPMTYIDGRKNVWKLDCEQGCYSVVEAGGRWEFGCGFGEQPLDSALRDKCWSREVAAMSREGIWTVREFFGAYSTGRLETLVTTAEGKREMRMSRERIEAMWQAVRRSHGEWVEWMKARGK
jgi:hypothetical protein